MNRADPTRLTGLLRGLAGILDPFADACEPERATYVGQTHHFLWDNEVAVFGFGKYKGQPLAGQHGYLKWMSRQSFPADVKRVIDLELSGNLKKE